MKFLVQFSRYFIALTFIFSGFVKLVDPIGSAYKFEEYFGADVLNLEFLIPYALPFSILLILIEIMLGVMLLIGYLPKVTSWSLLALIIVFLFLTWYSAYYNKVTDCGCFGDAIKLSSWGTFYKNVFFILLIILLVCKHKSITPWFKSNSLKWLTFLSFFSFLYISYYVLIHLPIIDFRPFAIGKSIPKGMEYIDNNDPEIHDFYLETNDGEEYTFKVLEEPKVLLITVYSIAKSDIEGIDKIATVIQKAEEEKYSIYVLTSSMPEEYSKIEESYNFKATMLFCDETTLKTMIRSNPGFITLSKGVVTDKKSWTDVDDLKF